ncbi:hypothetical protein SIN8267_00726 [Sinobacterium norvegicum]|uniref:tRNA uridine(34) hydroxylase n=1 Tax=Sinobacterium norvegicum TaxID=1641715 RepID=A0ABM9ACC4_9GAMM|nr:rhodanese-related sulfurtransferase [Sinobacterium norvegicum]CAH0990632.1 hypothetical protein SIN8267_00726 [Sinobacterium norvegicum]
MSQIVVCALYKFVRLENYQALQQPLLDVLTKHEIRGTLLLANEGINGTVAGSRTAIDALLNWFEATPGLENIVSKESFDDDMPFYRTKVKLKKEIVTMGVEGIDPQRVVGSYVKPADWNALIADPEVTVVDTRNSYEIGIGTFKHALDPETESFRQFPDYVSKNLDPAKNKKVAMFCTGGIRCEKSTAYLKEQGFDEVYHLEGGILKYLEEVPAQESLWQGECFVFDNRVSVNHDLEKGQYEACSGCRLPITEADKLSEKYQHGISCPNCFDTLTDKQRSRFEERERQVRLAKERGEEHIGSDAKAATAKRREDKLLLKQQQQKKMQQKP